MLIDCDQCEMRDIACPDCVVAVLLGGGGRAEIGEEERLALRILADARLVPPLRLQPPASRAS
ncbi:MAG: hypothetical protein QOJ73_2429 [Streptosporangiaceae bacterium]|jgi:hypothetical protein|nr:hypothetical protein [Streptosporangiaceae bacterium]